jgi:hypothetical protein
VAAAHEFFRGKGATFDKHKAPDDLEQITGIEAQTGKFPGQKTGVDNGRGVVVHDDRHVHTGFLINGFHPRGGATNLEDTSSNMTGR